MVEFHLNKERYSSPSILPFAVAGYDDADQRVCLLWMLLLLLWRVDSESWKEGLSQE